MAFISVNLPAPAGNGSGAAVNVSAFGSTKTITVQGNGSPLGSPFVTIEVSNDSGGVQWAPLETFVTPNQQTFEVACLFMRATISNYKGGTAPVIEVGGEDDTTFTASIPVPAGNGTGSAFNVASLPLFKTVQIGGAFQGVVNVEISEDGGTSWSTAFSFSQPGIQSQIIACNRMRVTRVGVPAVNPGTPICNVAATVPVGGGGGGGGGSSFENFVHTVDGTEPGFGTDTLTVTLPVARASTSYSALAGDGGRADGAFTSYSCPVSGYTLTTVNVSCEATCAVGDKIIIWVSNLSP